MRIILILAICACFAGTFRTAAQPDGNTYLDAANKYRDTLDFDITLFGKPLRAEFYVENTGNTTIYIPKKVVPFFSIERYSNAPSDFRHLEFTNETPLEFQVTTAKRKDTFRLIFISNPDTSKLDYALGFKIGRMVVGLADRINADLPFKKPDTFTLTAWKTKDYLASKKTEINFDSVYLSAENVRTEWMLKNVSDNSITVFGNRITPLSPVIGLSGFSVTTPLDTVRMPGESHQPWTIRYRPASRGADSARLALDYSPNINGHADSAQLILRGFGIQQEIILSNRTSGRPNPIIIRGDTIDAGDINIGEEAQINIVIENKGNLAFGGGSGTLGGQTDYFSLERTFNVAQRLPVGGFDTAIVRFKPARRGTFTATLTVVSDIRSRIPTAPDAASKITWFVRGRAVEPELALGTEIRDTINFGQFIMPADLLCPSASVRRFIARNIGNSTLTLTFDKTHPPFRVLGDSKLDILPDDSAVIEIEFFPQAVGAFSSTMTITTNEPDGRNFRSFVLAGSAVTQEVHISLPNIVSAAGRKVSASITVAATARYATSFSAVLIYDTTLLDFTGFEKNGTSSEDASLLINNLIPGAIAFTINDANGGLFKKDTLIKAEFSTYLGAPLPTLLTLAYPKAGAEGCDSTAHITIQNGRYSTDSSCGAAYRKIVGMKGLFRFAQIGENPASGRLEFAFGTAFPIETSIILYNSVGMEEAVLARGTFGEGMHYAEYSTDRCASGLYFVEMRAGIYRKLFPVIVVR